MTMTRSAEPPPFNTCQCLKGSALLLTPTATVVASPESLSSSGQHTAPLRCYISHVACSTTVASLGATCLPLLRTQVPHISTTMEELHRHPLWRYGSTAAQWPEPRSTSTRPLAAAEADSALLAYVRLVADAEQQQGMRRQKERARLSPTDVTAELHALYTLAALHITQQQDPSEQRSSSGVAASDKQPMSDGDIMQLLKAYASLEDSSKQHGSPDSSCKPQHGGSDECWDSRTQAAAAAMGALYAFAHLADAGAQQESQQDPSQHQQQPGQAPGQLQVSGSDGSSAMQAYKSLARTSQSLSTGSSTRGSSSTSRSTSGDLQVLLKLAQLGVQAAS